VTVSGKTVVAGAPSAGWGRILFQGVAYVFSTPATGWTNMTQTTKLASDGKASDTFGESVAVAGRTIVVGSFPLADVLLSAKAYIFVQPPGGG
jgi:hypothetical protein